jgi:hypothetical protein
MEIDPRRALTVPEFCWLEHLSKSKFFELKRRGLAPTTTDVDGLQRISPQSREDWHERMAALAKSEAAQLEAERRRELADRSQPVLRPRRCRSPSGCATAV